MFCDAPKFESLTFEVRRSSGIKSEVGPDSSSPPPDGTRKTKSPRKAKFDDSASARETRHAPRAQGFDRVRIFVGAGRLEAMRPGDLVGAIANEAGLSGGEIGAIEIADRFSLVEVPAEHADEVIQALRRTTIRGRKVLVRRDRDS